MKLGPARFAKKFIRNGYDERNKRGFCTDSGYRPSGWLTTKSKRPGCKRPSQRIRLGVASSDGTPHCDLDKYNADAATNLESVCE